MYISSIEKKREKVGVLVLSSSVVRPLDLGSKYLNVVMPRMYSPVYSRSSNYLTSYGKKRKHVKGSLLAESPTYLAFPMPSSLIVLFHV